MIKQILTIIFLTCFTLCLWADQGESQLQNLKAQLEQAENNLYQHEFTLDGYYQEMWKFNGVGGFFNGMFSGGKKKLQQKTEKQEAAVQKSTDQVKNFRNEIQNKIYNIASGYENSGDHKKAIDWYLQLESINDPVKFRIGTCYRNLNNYAEAIRWFMKHSSSDSISYEIAECYRLWEHYKDAGTWYFKVCYNFNNTPVQNSALMALENLDYPQKLSDFPDFYEKLSNTYISKTFMLVNINRSEAQVSYRKACEFHSMHFNTGSLNESSYQIVSFYEQIYRQKVFIYDEQKVRAEEYYQDRLRRARHEHERAGHRLNEGINRANQEFDRKLRQSHREVEEARAKLQQVEQKEGVTPEEIQSAKNWLQRKQREHSHLMRPDARRQYVENEVYNLRRNVEKTRKEYDYVMYNRDRIINEYLNPFLNEMRHAEKVWRDIANLASESIY